MKLFIAIPLILLLDIQVSGQTTFQKIYSSPDGAYIYSADPLNDGGYIFTMYPNSLTRTDSLGNIVWAKKFSSYNSNEDLTCRSAIQTLDSGFLMCTSAQLSLTTIYNLYITKLNAAGDTSWVRYFSNYVLGLPLQNADSTFTIYGAWNNSLSTYMMLMKLNTSGDTIWKKFIGHDATCLTALIMPDHGYLLGGVVGYTNNDAFLVRTDSNGDTLWAKAFSTSYEDDIWSVCLGPDSSIFAAVTNHDNFGSHSDFSIIRLNYDGDTVWTRSYSGNHLLTVRKIFATNDSALVVMGTDYLNGTHRYFSAKLNTTGDTIWTWKQDTSSSLSPHSGGITSMNGIFFAGLGSTSGTSGGILAKGDSAGTIPCINEKLNLTISHPGYQEIKGQFAMVTGGFTIYSPGLQEGLLNLTVTDCNNIQGFSPEDFQGHHLIYPVPTSDFLNIVSENEFMVKVEVLNTSGVSELVQTLPASENRNTTRINVVHLMPGIYFLQIESKDKIYRMKFMKG